SNATPEPRPIADLICTTWGDTRRTTLANGSRASDWRAGVLWTPTSTTASAAKATKARAREIRFGTPPPYGRRALVTSGRGDQPILGAPGRPAAPEPWRYVR